MMKNLRGIVWVALIVFGTVLQPLNSDAKLFGKHKDAVCGDCHGGGGGFAVALFSQGSELNCLNNSALCHTNKQFDVVDASQRFGSFTATASPKGTSHAWGVPYDNVSAGASRPGKAIPSIYGPGYLGCSSCHYPHYTPFGSLSTEPLLKLDNTSDALCLDCHKNRNISDASVNDPNPWKQKSHPVGVTIPDDSAHNSPPRDQYPAAGSQLKLVGPSADTVSCSTCHGVHFADSNPNTAATWDVLSSVPGGKGVLLRRYNDNELCRDCHNYMGHSTTGQQLCRNCHDPHLGDGKNFRLIYSNLSTPAYGIITTVFDNLSTQFAGRSDGKRGICDACHLIVGPSKYFANWSTKHQTLDVYPSDVATTNCLNCHAHAVGVAENWKSFAAGGAYACSACHGFPPRANTFAGPSGFAQYSSPSVGWYNYADDSATQPEVNESTSPHVRHAMDYPYDAGSGFPGPTGTCYACHAVEDHYDTDNRDFQNVIFGLYSRTPGNYGTYDEAVGNRTCAGVYCHSKPDNDDTVADANVTAFSWNQTPGQLAALAAGGNICNACHDAVPTTNKHDKHVNGAVGNYSFGCINCHDETVSDNSTIKDELSGYHVNRQKDVFFTATAVGGSYLASSKQCSATYCHGNFPNGNNAQPLFNGTAVCGSCHDLAPVAGPVTHLVHVDNYGFECAYCHSKDGGSGFEMAFDTKSTIQFNELHVNGVDDVEFGNDTVRPNTAGEYINDKCGNTYCHSDGTNLGVQPYFGNVSAQWSTASVVCSDCHGDAALGGWTTAMPNYVNGTNGKENSHFAHVKGNDIACVTCHEQTLFDNYSISFTNGSSTHVNHEYDVDIALAYDTNGAGVSNYTPNAAGGICNNISCHGTDTPQWGTTLACSDCHNGAGDVDDFSYQNNTTATIDQTQWDNSGHGNTGGFGPSTNPAADLVCDSCHDGTNVAHGLSTNPFRLFTSDTEALCNGCHGTGAQTSVLWNDPTTTKLGIFKHASSTTSGKYSFDLKCVDCHDPHGDDNAFMIHSTLPRVNDQANKEVSDQYGTPKDTITEWRNVDFPDRSAVYYGSTTVSIATVRVCNVCHEDTTDINNDDGSPGTSTLARYRYDMNSGAGADAHRIGQTCANCHQHTGGFKGVSCAGCHGNPPIDGGTMISYPNLTTSQSNTAGMHESHVIVYPDNNLNCSYCHSEGMLDNPSDFNQRINIKFRGMDAYTTMTGANYDGQAAVAGGFYPYSGAQVSAGGSYTCTNIKCHGSALTNGQGFDVTPEWNDIATGNCGACHGAKKSAGTPFTNASAYPASGVHQKHAGFATGEYDILCKTCHDTTLTTATTLDNTIHVNAETGVTGVDINAAYDNDGAAADNFSYNDGSDQCSNVDCHGENVVSWTPGALGCGNCHEGASDVDNWIYSNLSGTVAKIDTAEYNSTGHGNFGKNCDDCHDGALSHTTSTTYFRLYSTTEPDTFCLYCHGSGSELMNGWFGNVTGIQGHTYSNMSAAAYGNLTTWSYTPKCIDCHDPHGDSNAMMIHTTVNYFGSDAAGRPTGGTKSVSAVIFDRWSSYVRADLDGICQVCHERTDFFKKGEFSQHNLGQQCTDCHAHSTGFTPQGACDTCHLDASDVDDFAWGAPKALINEDEWGAGKHALNGVECPACHDESVSHNTSTNYFRLYTSDTVAICDNCHNDGSSVYNTFTTFMTANATKTNMFTHSSSVFGNATAAHEFFDMKCIDCHDPHGDTFGGVGNDFMLHSSIYEPVGGVSSDQYGIPSGTPVDLNFTAQGTGEDYGSTAASNNLSLICNVCHTLTEDPSTGDMRFRQDMASGGRDTTHNVSTPCTNCHSHAGGFKGVACDGCHGNPPGAFISKNDVGPVSSGSVIAGAHITHRDALAAQASDVCAACHDTGMSTAFGYNATIDLDFRGWSIYTTGTYAGQFAVDGGSISYGGAGSVPSDDSLKCSNVKCHGGGTPTWLTSSASLQDPTWDDTTSAECGDCHGAKTAPGPGGSWPTTWAHATHADHLQYDLMCATCHNATVADDNTTLTDANHVNELSAVVLDTDNVKIDTTGGYSEDTVNGGLYESCDNTYCHSEGNRLSNYSAPKVALNWDDNATCGSCHGDANGMPDYAPGAPKFNSHSTHVVGKGYGCEDCHNVTTTNGTTIANYTAHVNRAYNVNLIGTYDVGSFAYTGTECSEVNCHGGDTTLIRAGATGNDITPDWGDTATAECGDCHLTDTSTPKITHGGHDKHITGGTNYSFACTRCHTDSTSADHVDQAIDFIGSTTKAATAACDACHILDNDDVAAGVKDDWDAGTDRTCISCHNAKATQGLMTFSHPVHTNNGTYINFKCAFCHSDTVAVGDDNVISNLAMHANMTTNVVFNSFNGNDSTGSINAALECSTLYCHSNGTDIDLTGVDANADPNVTPDWDLQPAMGCTGCHGNIISTYGDYRDAMPNYADEDPKNNSHVTHVVTNNIDCMQCHVVTLEENNTINTSTGYAQHIDGTYDVDFPSDDRYGASAAYVAGGTCNNVKCHGYNTVTWGAATAPTCVDCHNTTGADVDNFAYTNMTSPTMTMALIDDADWLNTGHGRTTNFPAPSTRGPANQLCSGCHDSSIGHGDAGNPFRLYSSDTIQLCSICHNGGDLQEHHALETTAGRWDFNVKCVDCHDPHGDSNIFMIHGAVYEADSGNNWDISNALGVPYLPATYTVNFSDNGTAADYATSASTDNNTEVCNVCHTRTDQGNGKRYNRNQSVGAEAPIHKDGQLCSGCHTHPVGFEGAGESGGNSPCTDSCHDFVSDMTTGTSTYHHYMQNTDVTNLASSGTKYPNDPAMTTGDTDRRCLMCHADHDIFNSAVNPDNPYGRAGNLRESINTEPDAGSDTNFSNSDFVANGEGGICISCHTNSQTKNLTNRLDDGSIGTLVINYNDYLNSPHNYEVNAPFATDGMGFKANCVKCHNDTFPKTKFENSTAFGLHDSKLRRMNSQLGSTIYDGTAATTSGTGLTISPGTWTAGEWNTRNMTMTSGGEKGKTFVITENTGTDTLLIATPWPGSASPGDTFVIGDPPEQDYCYNCHGKQNPNWQAVPPKDYYGVASYANTKAVLMEPTFSGDYGDDTALSTTATSLTDGDKAWVIDAYADFTVKATSGKNAGSYGTIASNDGTTLTLTGAGWSNGGPSGDYSVGNPFRHRIDNFGGLHESDEALTAPPAISASGWFGADGGNTGVHVGCQDCHNPHAQTKPATDRGYADPDSDVDIIVDYTKSWTPRALVGFKFIPVDNGIIGEERMIYNNTADTLYIRPDLSAQADDTYYYVYPSGRADVASAAGYTGDKGNMLNGPNNGQWGVSLSYAPSPPIDTLVAPTYSLQQSLSSRSNKIYELCIKCHSQYAWGTGGTAFECMDCDATTVPPGSGMTTDLAKEFNPNNLAHHAVVEPGKNQPITVGGVGYWNTNWPNYKDTIGSVNGQEITFDTNVFDIVQSAIPGWYIFTGNDTPTQGVSSPWLQITEITAANKAIVTGGSPGTGAYMLTAGLGNNFVPPFGPWSVISCADCHDSDGDADPKGPHGSGQNWLLRGYKKQNFSWWDGGTMQDTSYGPNGWTDDNSKLLCHNCHRADIYGGNGETPEGGGSEPSTGDFSNFTWRANWARENHVPDGNDSRAGLETFNVFKIYCMNCHLGDAMGDVHGTNAGKGPGGSYRGKRFLTGGSWTGVTRGSTGSVGLCWMATTSALNTCSDGRVGATYDSGLTSNYDYEPGVD